MNANPNPYPHGRWTPRVVSAVEPVQGLLLLATRELDGVSRQSEAAAALWLEPITHHPSQSGVALRLPPQSKSTGSEAQTVGPTHGLLRQAA